MGWVGLGRVPFFLNNAKYMLLDLAKDFLGGFGEWGDEGDEVGVEVHDLHKLHRAGGFGH